MLPLRTDRLLLYPCRLPLLTEIYLQNPHAAVSLQAVIPPEWPQPELKEQLPHFIEQLQHDPGSFPWMLWIIVSQADNTVLGDIGFKGRPDPEGMVEIGYALLPAYRRQGFMQEAATALINWAFGQPHVEKVVAECHVTNIASMRVLQKLGMRETGRSPEMIYWQILNNV
ncbi:GNAT family N-acetyltransferase [Chitinophaga nivalis]|uniref:GNAT family N-acetyltransferase n=1 Tax=Chitinophaga nivalis TaxID=2991709 RepID=A0ABT3IVT5_9BACT|nr:GNAT family protein [Chitinophaga nivalis]MCW3462254.1 GNAT family N-acetyltransferase [Chitinophaga nivalis]MCW3488054.1 GNAT family N-acetyltransferase [Chitinophaga nivalis]